MLIGQLKAAEAERRWYLFFLLPALALLVSITLGPFLYSVYVSLHEWSLRTAEGLTFIGFRNYVDLFKDPQFRNSILVTGSFWVLGLLIQLPVGFAIALLLNREMKVMRVLRTVILLPMMVTPIVVALMWQMMLNNEYGAVRHLLNLVGFQSVPIWLGDPRTSLLTLVVIDSWQWTPMVVLFSLAGLRTLPSDHTEAALIEGARLSHMLRYVILPWISQVLLVVVVLRTMDIIKLFDKIYVMTKGGPGTSTETMTYYAYRQGFGEFNMGYASALSVIILILVILISTRAIKLFRKR